MSEPTAAERAVSLVLSEDDYFQHPPQTGEIRAAQQRVRDVLAALRALSVDERMEAMGMERSGWSGHRRGGVWNEIGRVHDKNSVHMDGCIPLYVEIAP